MHLTFSSIYDKEEAGSTHVRIDISNESYEAGIARHSPIHIDRDQESARGDVYYGAGYNGPIGCQSSSIAKADGFPGHYRQFWMTLGDLDFENQIKLLRHQYKVMDYSTLAYYKFEST